MECYAGYDQREILDRSTRRSARRVKVVLDTSALIGALITKDISGQFVPGMAAPRHRVVLRTSPRYQPPTPPRRRWSNASLPALSPLMSGRTCLCVPVFWINEFWLPGFWRCQPDRLRWQEAHAYTPRDWRYSCRDLPPNPENLGGYSP